MKVTLIIWISAIILQEVEPGTIARIPRDVAKLKSSIHTEYEANYKQKGKHGNDSFSTIKGNQEILHENCNDTWNEFAEKCAGLVKDLIASLANTISSSPGDATNLQLHIKNNFTHVDTSHKRNCFKRPPTCLSNLNISSLFNNETGNILNKPNADAPITVLTTLKKSDSCDESSPTPIRPNNEDVILDNSSEVPKRSQQGSSLDYGNGAHMNPEEAEALTGPEINNNRRQVKYPTSELVESENTVFRPEDSTTDPSTGSRLPVVPLNAETLSSNNEPHVAFDPNDMSLEVSAVPSNPPFNIRNTSPNPYSVNGLDNSGNSYLDPSLSTENMSSRGPKARGVAGQPYSSSESSNEFFPNLIDRKNSISPKYTSQEVSSEEDKYHTYLPPQSLIGEPLNGESQPLREDFESEEKPNHKIRGHVLHEENDLLPEKMPRPAAHHHHPPLSKMENEEPPLPHIPHHPFITPTATPPVLKNPALPPGEHSQSKEPSSPLLLADHTPDLSKTNVPHHSISHQDPLQELKPHASHHPHPIESQPIITDDSTPPIIVPVSEPRKTQPEILPTQISNVEPPAKEVSHDDYSNGNQPALPLESIPPPVSTEPQILSFPQSSGKPLEASNHLSPHNTEPAAPVGELVLSEEIPSYGSPENESLDDKPAPPPLPVESITHFDKPSFVEEPEIAPAHDPHKTHPHSHHHPHPHALPYPPPHHHPHHHPGSTVPADEDDVDKKPLPEVKHIPIIESEEKPSSPKRELTHPHPSHPKIDSDPTSVSEKELPPSPPPKVELVPISLPEKELPPPPPPKTELVPAPPVEKELPSSPPPKMELVPVSLPEKELPPPPPPKIELVPVPVVEKALPPPPKEKELPPPKIELVPVPEKELPPPPPPPPPHLKEKELPPPPPPKMELVPVPPVEKELPPPPPPKMELVPVSLPEKELPPPPPPKIELVPVPVVEKALPPPPPKEKELPPPKIELVPVPVIEKELPPPPPSPHLKEKELPPPPPPKMELVPVFPPEKELPPPPPPPPPKVELVPVSVIEKELPPPPPPPPHHSKEKELPPPKMQLVPDFPSEKELPPPKVELVPVIEKELPPPKMELVPVSLPEKEVVVPEKEFPPPPPKVELVPVLPLEKELPPPPPPSPPKVELVPVMEKKLPPPKMELVPVLPPEKELPPPPPPKMELVPISLSEKELPPPPPKVELVPVLPQEKELPPPPPKVELVPISLPEKELPPPPPPKVELVPVGEKDPPPPKMELVPISLPEKELPPPPPKVELVPVLPQEKELPPPPPKIELVPVSLPEKELPPPPKPELALVPATEEELPHKVKLVPFPSSEQNEIPGHDSKEDKPFADMPWPAHAPHPSHHHHPDHPERPDHPAPHHPHPPPPPPPPHHHHPHHPPPHHPHHPHKKEEHEDDSLSYSKELQALEEEKELENEKATTFQTTAADPTPPETTLSYPPFFMTNPTSQAPPPLTIPNSEGYPLTPSATTFETVPTSKPDDDDDEDDYEDCCTCESCREGNESGVKVPRTSACQDLEQARRELKAIFDKIKKKLKCGRKTQRPAITT